MRRIQTKSTLLLILMLCAGVVLGGFIGDCFGSSSAFSWLAYGKSFGITSPLFVDLGVFTLQFAFTIKITIAGLIGFLIAAIIYKVL